MDKKKYRLELEGKDYFEKFLLLLSLGLMDAVKDNIISIEDAERILFRPATIKKLRGLEVGLDILDLIKSGCEIEDFDSIKPEKLDEYIDSLKSTTKTLLLGRKTRLKNVPRTEKEIFSR